MKKEMEEKGNGKGMFGDNILMFGRASAYGTYSKLLGSSSIKGLNANALAAPTYKFNDNLFFILMGKTNYLRSKQVYTEDRGSKLRSENATFSILPTVRHNVNDRLSLSPSYFFTTVLTKETTDETWGDGLYDYRDHGVGMDVSYRMSRTKSLLSKITVGGQFYQRKYPNFISLFSLTGIGSIEEREKDFYGCLFTAKYIVRKKDAISYHVFFSTLLKKYSDKLIENIEGGRDDRKQNDQVYTLGLNLDYTKGNFRYRLGTTGTMNSSNQNLASGFFPNIEFTNDYYDYHSLLINPSLQYFHRLPNKKDLVLGISYDFTVKKFTNRKAKDKAGNKTSDDEVDYYHNFNFNANYKFDKHWGVRGIVALKIADSNNKNASTFRPNYEILNLSLGLTYQY